MNPELLRKSSLEDQFNNPEKLELYGDTVEVVDISPEQKGDEVPTVVAPGWIATPEVYKDIILELARERRVISVNAPHGVKTEDRLQVDPNAEFRKAVAVLNSLDAKGIEKADIVAHSEGGLYMTLAATAYPEKFRKLILVDSAGMIGKDRLPRLVVDFSKDLVVQFIKDIREERHIQKSALRTLTEGTKSVFRNPLQTIRRVLALADADIRDMLIDLKKKGIEIYVIHAVDDLSFPMKRVQEAISPEHVDGFLSVRGDHGGLIYRSKEYAHLVAKILNAPEKVDR